MGTVLVADWLYALKRIGKKFLANAETAARLRSTCSLERCA
jgi:hypothetical protein